MSVALRCCNKHLHSLFFLLREYDYPAFIAPTIAFSKDIDVVNRIALFVVEIAHHTVLIDSRDVIHRLTMNACSATNAIT